MSLSEIEKAWWARSDDHLEDEDPKAHEKLHVVINEIQRTQDRKRDFLLYGSMYAGGIPPAGGGLAVDQYVRSTPGVQRGNLSLNVSRNVVDAVCARVFSKSKPKLSYVTEGGDYERQDNAAKLERGVEGTFYREEYYDKSVDKGRDGCVFGSGFLRIRPNFDRKGVDIIRMMGWEVIYDDGEAVFGEPCSEYLSYYVDKYVLAHRVAMGWYARGSAEDWAYKASQVERLKGLRDNDAEFGYQQTANRVLVEEAWHKPSGVGAKDGRYVVGVENCTLIDEPIDEFHTEISCFRWSKPIVGFYGQGIVELGAGIQAEINKLVREIQTGHHLIKGHYLIEQGSKVQKAHINNDIATLLAYTGTPPVFQAPTIISPEVYQHLWNLVQKYYEISGVNQQAAQAQKPVGLNSGEAQRVYADQQTETLLEKGQRFEESVKKDGQLVTNAAKRLAEKVAYEVRAFDDEGYETIDWKKLDDPDGYELKVHATSSLPGTPAGKIELAEDMLKLGNVDPADVMEIVGMPDILQLTRRKQASRKLVEKKVGEMLRTGIGWEPPSYINIPEAAMIATEMLCLAEAKEVDEERLTLVRDFINKCNRLLTKMKPPPAPLPQAAPGVAVPMGPPPGVPAAGPPAMPPGANGGNGVMQ